MDTARSCTAQTQHDPTYGINPNCWALTLLVDGPMVDATKVTNHGVGRYPITGVQKWGLSPKHKKPRRQQKRCIDETMSSPLEAFCFLDLCLRCCTLRSSRRCSRSFARDFLALANFFSTVCLRCAFIASAWLSNSPSCVSGQSQAVNATVNRRH